jgi:hypothetical protein
MGSCAGRNHPAQVSGHDDIRIRAANTGLGAFSKGVHATGPHVANPAAQSHIAEPALRLLRLMPVPHGLDIILMGFFK